MITTVTHCNHIYNTIKRGRDGGGEKRAVEGPGGTKRGKREVRELEKCLSMQSFLKMPNGAQLFDACKFIVHVKDLAYNAESNANQQC